MDDFQWKQTVQKEVKRMNDIQIGKGPVYERKALSNLPWHRRVDHHKEGKIMDISYGVKSSTLKPSASSPSSLASRAEAASGDGAQTAQSSWQWCVTAATSPMATGRGGTGGMTSTRMPLQSSPSPRTKYYECLYGQGKSASLTALPPMESPWTTRGESLQADTLQSLREGAITSRFPGHPRPPACTPLSGAHKQLGPRMRRFS
eukprot:TRINITY_DN16986_c0_g1_i1.p1 TRINITY_DN16986_c0_g1~~TRINITY_DN16986_c0_g1_i1.p1  ORF type:complete len:204 (+),score=31.42 TRINITY_DN16986_c0_g1_i1:101-712(+)